MKKSLLIVMVFFFGYQSGLNTESWVIETQKDWQAAAARMLLFLSPPPRETIGFLARLRGDDANGYPAWHSKDMKAWMMKSLRG
jgi:hypothetical protein